MEDERLGLPSSSSWRRYELCPGSFQLEQEARALGQEAHQAPTVASERGDRIHLALADEGAQLSESELETAEFLRERADDQIKRIFGDEPVTVLKEQRLWLQLGCRPAASGQFDRVIYTDRIALVQDYKTGWAEPDPAEINAQLKFLSVVVAMNLGHVTEVIAQIISGPFGVTETRFNLSELAHAYNDIVTTLRKLHDPQAMFNPTPEACQFCPAVNICQAVKDLILPIARLQREALPDGERASQLLTECELLEDHINSIRDYYAEKLLGDESYSIPGWTMEQGPPKRTVTDWHTARERLEEYIDSGDLNGAESYKIVAIEKALGKKLKLRNAELKAKLAEILAGLIEEKYPAKSLKRVKDETS